MNLHTIFLMSQPSGSSSGAGYMNLVLLVAVFAVMYFFMIRPQSKKAKDQRIFLENLQKGDKIVTIAGIHGTVNKVNEDGTLMLEVSPGSYIKIEKQAISQEMTANVNKAATETKS